MKSEKEKLLAAAPACKACSGVGWVWKLASAGQHGGVLGRRWMRCTACRGYGLDLVGFLDGLGLTVKPKPSAPPAAAQAAPGPSRATRSAP